MGNYAFYGCSSLTSATFENITGWKVNDISIYVGNSETAATYLRSTYSAYYWKRS